MDTVAYIYFNSPEKDSVIDLFKEIIKSGVNVTHFGRNDPPKKWNATPDEMNNELFKEEAETNKWCFLKDQKQKIEMTIHITYADNWSFSDIDISGKNKENTINIASHLAESINSYLCIQGSLGKGKDQKWNILYESKTCPKNIKDGINFA